jgi:hypothetical protein
MPWCNWSPHHHHHHHHPVHARTDTHLHRQCMRGHPPCYEAFVTEVGQRGLPIRTRCHLRPPGGGGAEDQGCDSVRTECCMPLLCALWEEGSAGSGRDGGCHGMTVTMVIWQPVSTSHWVGPAPLLSPTTPSSAMAAGLLTTHGRVHTLVRQCSAEFVSGA